jgi:Tol biopolymer transport system component
VPTLLAADEATVLFTSDRSGNFEMYVMKPDGTGVRRLTENTFKDSRGRWSPDGTRIYFIRDDKNIWVMDRDGGNQKFVTEGRTVAVSPDGTKLVLSRKVYYGGGIVAEHLYAFDLATGSSRVLVSEVNYNYNPAFLPDGSGVIYVNELKGFYAGQFVSYKNLCRVDISGQNRRDLTNYDEWISGFPDAPSVSPDGKLIVFSNRNKNSNEILQTVSIDGTGKIGFIQSSSGGLVSPVWSPDGTRVLTSLNGRIINASYPHASATWLTDGNSLDYPTDWLRKTIAPPLDETIVLPGVLLLLLN